MPPIAYFSVVRGKDPQLKYETATHGNTGRWVGHQAHRRYYGISRNPSGSGCVATDRITCPA